MLLLAGANMCMRPPAVGAALKTYYPIPSHQKPFVWRSGMSSVKPHKRAMQAASSGALARLLRRPACIFARQLASATEGSAHVGATYDLIKTFTQADVDQFLHDTGDSNPIHRDLRAAQLAGFEAPIIPGMLLASLFPAIIGTLFPGAVYATQSLAFRAPAMIGQPVQVVVSVTRTSQSGRTSFDTRCYAGDSRELLLDGKAMAILPPPPARAP